jgi:hypothetical protein
MTRVLLAGLLGGIALFAWESVAHLALPLGQVGVKPLPQEQQVIASLKANINEAGFYYFPAPTTPPATGTGFNGIMVVQPNGNMSLAPGQLITQLVGDILAVLVAAVLLSWTSFPAFGTRVLFVTLMGLLPTLAVDVPYWNWYAFPASYTLSQFTVHLVGFAVAGLVLAKMIHLRTSAPVKQALKAA